MAAQCVADLVSVLALDFNLHIPTQKLRVFHHCGLDTPPLLKSFFLFILRAEPRLEFPSGRRVSLKV